MEDIATGRFHADVVDAHIKRARIFFRSKFGFGWSRRAPVRGWAVACLFPFFMRKLRADYFFFV